MSWRLVEEFDSDALVGAVERVVIKQDTIDVVMKYRQVANGLLSVPGRIVILSTKTAELGH
ncbi:hypothetical protein [Sphaerochaeta halotolerans]|uniref:hypothetical protein n=1 Tax=Sphaerochaeta halotolerans TaxID=2293840 RepID=UPI001058C099|nr:hypothetical protein [Sphaerochaeta halotolerans]MXI86950.1 hypothetical protein [Sphaerochaeta halotolerans]